MEIVALILSAVAVLGILIAFKFRGIFYKIISFGLIVTVLFLWIDNKYIITSSFLIFGVLTITTFIYGLLVKNISTFEKISIAIMGLFLTNSFIFSLFHLPFAAIIKLSMIVPITITVITFIRCRKLTKEMSFMIFWLFHATLKFLSLWIH